MDEDSLVVDWIRHYLTLIVAFVVVGVVGTFAYHEAVPDKVEAWSLVVETSGAIPPRQLGPVALVIFQSAAVYRPVMQQLGVTQAPSAFLRESVDLRPVPETNTLIVVGRAASLPRAELISGAMARALVNAFQARGEISGFRVFSDPQPAPVRQGLSLSVAEVLGGMAALWLGLAVAAIHYRVRRPVLSLSRATSLLRPVRVTVAESRRTLWTSWRRPRLKDTPANRALVERVTTMARTVPLIEPGERDGRFAFLGSDRRPSAGAATDRGTARGALVVCEAATPIPDLALVPLEIRSDDGAAPIELLWVN